MVDATNVQQEARAPLVALARKFQVLPVATVFDLPESLCQERNRDRAYRAYRSFGPHVIGHRAYSPNGIMQLRRNPVPHLEVVTSAD